MASVDLLQRWLGWWQPLSGGLTPWGLANGLMLTGGWFWSRIRGGYNLYRGAGSRENIDWTRPIGAAGYDATEIWEFDWVARGQGGRFWYALRAVGGGGIEAEEPNLAAACQLDEAGLLQGALPGDVARAWAEPIEEGRIQLRWRYSSVYQGARPTQFVIYHDNGSGQIDYANPAGVVEYDLRRRFYTWTSEPYGDGTRVRFYVCAASAAGEGNGASAEAIADSTVRSWPGVMRIETGESSEAYDANRSA